MTRDEILALPAGRELDAVVVEAQGHTVKQRICHWYPGDEFWEETESLDPHKSDIYGSIEPCYQEDKDRWIVVPEYSTDLSDAWGLVEEVRRTGLLSGRKRFLLLLQASGPKVGTAYVAWPDMFFFVTPEVICRAYLLWRWKVRNADEG